MGESSCVVDRDQAEENGQYSPVADAFKTDTLVSLATTERDFVRLRFNVRGEDARLYQLLISPGHARLNMSQRRTNWQGDQPSTIPSPPTARRGMSLSRSGALRGDDIKREGNHAKWTE